MEEKSKKAPKSKKTAEKSAESTTAAAKKSPVKREKAATSAEKFAVKREKAPASAEKKTAGKSKASTKVAATNTETAAKTSKRSTQQQAADATPSETTVKASRKKATPEIAEKAPAKKATTKKIKAEAATPSTATAKSSVKKSKTAEATAPEKKTVKSSAPKSKAAEVKAPSKATAKTSAAKKAKIDSKEAAADTAKVEKAKKSSTKKPALQQPKTEVESAPIAKEKKTKASASKKPKAAAASTEASAITATAPEGETPKKVRTKPRRRELKRLGLLKPKENKKQRRADEARARAEGKELKPLKRKDNPAKKDEPRKDQPKPDDRRDDSSREDRKPSKKPKTPEAFGAFQPRVNEKLERKNERRQARQEKEERERDQSHGFFEEPIRLNRFVALSGVCSRRDADILISEGKVKVNGKVVKEMGFKVTPGKDKVVYKDNELRIKVFVYLLMNKPKNRITTTEDELGRDTVMEIAEQYTKTRVYPVGRLDRNTTGLLLLTNDGDLTMKLTHPSSKIPKVYQARLDKDFEETDFQALLRGFELEDGFIKADKADYVADGVRNEIGIQIHSGANHIVKRMLAHLGYEVIALDRVQLGPLNKRGLPRGKCRMLTEKEVGFLKML